MGADTMVMTARASNTRVIVNIIVNLLTAGPHSTLVPRWARLGRGVAGHRHAWSGTGRTGMTGKTSALGRRRLTRPARPFRLDVLGRKEVPAGCKVSDHGTPSARRGNLRFHHAHAI